MEFREIQGKGLGTLATKDIEKGELVMASLDILFELEILDSVDNHICMNKKMVCLN